MASPGGTAARANSDSFKVVLLGEGAVGKTSVVLSYVEGKFNEKHTTTLQASFLTKKLSLGGRRVTLAIWDTAGQERFHALGPIYYRESHGACLIYDVTDEDSFQKVKNWVRELRKMLGSEICLVICGNKIDLAKDRVVELSTALAYADSVGARHFETSAKTGEGIEEVFLFLSQQMLRVRDSRDAPATGSLRRRQNVVVVEEPEPEPAKRSCCG
ncbi:ras-related protein Rab-21-like [Amphibalanus amphitrite]|uniref:ras-related protein Rab-21-like n=1 Tax=Amphibalanus amphitrite TaxID=1232801 RepID=UPI001C91CB65|nr:ras-related protein Rab-21-like [Amphibalanus amphitrite]XP_043229575.1 ras-related protein Rab-21-like [Amphibalanus amphitrite]XP_043229582.1 ras-related protein Rab-21-like [Amphibalanus amphitrite]XP_043229587.1 ras-related protein Rab-21-like [Amphibalanus amphitrite]XP_043229593.1 ras-related protein Rab-21-like [Amphibalanus amphitrite]XP_043229601.1 ras-related protein Rab-21-like [Amphibalanus amphitrite]